jgi:diguanylate cyclase (GGDEF)-like protein
VARARHLRVLRGFAVRRNWIRAALVLIVFAPEQRLARSAEPPTATMKPLTSIGDVNRYYGPSCPVGIPVRVKAQVTYVDADWGILFVQDQTGAIYVKVGKEGAALKPGDVVDLRASTSPGAVGPILTKPHFLVINHAALHAAGPFNLTSLQGGGEDSQFVVTRGVLRPGPEVWNHTSLSLVDGQTEVPLQIPGGVNSSILSLVGAVVRVRAVSSAHLNEAGRRIGAQLFVSSIDDIQPEDHGWISVSRGRLTRIGDLRNLDLRQRFLPAVHVKGAIAWKSSQDVFIRDETGGAFIHAASPFTADKGSAVDVIGFPDRHNGSIVIRDAIVRFDTASTWPKAPPAHREPAAWLVRSGQDGQRVEVAGKLISQEKGQGNEYLLTLDDSGIRFWARVGAADGPGQMITISPNAMVQCDGVVRMIRGSSGSIESFELLVDSPSDMVVQTRRQLSLKVVLAFGMPFCAGAVLLWIIQLKRSVRAKTVQIRKQMDELQQARDAARIEAEQDALTGLPNRRRFFQLLEERTQSAAEDRKSLALLYIDLDGFKMINDTLGHFMGDLLLKEVAGRFSGCVAPGDTLCRIGGDEFALIVERLDAAKQSAELLLQAAQSGFRIQEQDVVIGATIGISTFPHPGCDATTLLLQADAAMYAAKRAGKNELAFYTDEMGSVLNEKNRMSLELKNAIKRGEICLEYQPQFDARTMTILRFEALARWTNSSLGAVPPDKFIPIAEECGFIRELGAYILERACRDAVQWNDQCGQRVPVAVNVSALQLRSDSFADQVFETLRKTRLDPELLELEMTESVMVEDLARIAENLEEFRRAGITLALDDFGTGYSCLAYLRQLPFDRLKVDPSFLRQADLDSGTATLITAVANVAHALHMRVVVEGIETEREMHFVTRLGADELQGFLLGRPNASPIDVLLAHNVALQQ